MKIIIDGDGIVPNKTALDLLKDIARPYPECVFVHLLLPKGVEPPSWYKALNILDDANYRNVSVTLTVKAELQLPGEKMFIVADAETRPDLVRYCVDNGIQVLDLTRALYPVGVN